MTPERYNKEIIQKGIDSTFLSEHPVFFDAMTRVLSKYAELEEKTVADPARLTHYAQMRRAVFDIAEELEQITSEGNNAASSEQLNLEII